MSEFYDLYDYCKRTTENNNIRKKKLLENKNSIEKNNLFRIITEEAYNTIKTRANEGYDYAILYDDEYNKLIIELTDILTQHFRPFNIHYKKKNKCDRSLIEIFKDESNHILIIDWKDIIIDDISKNINEFPTNRLCDNDNYTINIKIDNQNEHTELKTIKSEETINSEESINSEDFEKIF
tara:strand:- start:4 stop:546 length:543 start_codon:yes stop_codon:yes gene_type:complete